MSGSRSTTRTTSTSVVDTQNLNLQDIEGVAFAGEFGGDVTLTDQGSVEAARQIAIAALGVGRAGFEETAALTREVLTAGRRQTETVAGIASDIAERESGNVDARIQAIATTALVGAGIVVVVFVFRNRKKS